MESAESGSKDARVTFRLKIREAIDTAMQDFVQERTYYHMKKVFDEEISRSTMGQTHKIKQAARRLGVNYRTFRRMLFAREE